MNQRVHIHQEELTLTSEVRHFSIVLPSDVKKVFGINGTAYPQPDPSFKEAREAGRLRLTRDGVFLCDIPVRMEGKEVTVGGIKPPGVIDGDYRKALSGTHAQSWQFEFSGSATVINCLYRGSSLFGEYRLTVYIYYEPKT